VWAYVYGGNVKVVVGRQGRVLMRMVGGDGADIRNDSA